MPIKNMTPMLSVASIQKTLDFYKDILDFDIIDQFEEDGSIKWACIESGDIEMMFSQQSESAKSNPSKKKGIVLYFYVEDVQELHSNLRNKGYETADLRVTIYGMREFQLEDPDGYELWLAEPTTDPPTVRE